MAERALITGLGGVTALGCGAWPSAAAVRAGISGFAEHPYMVDTVGEPLRIAQAQWIEIDRQGTDRLEALLSPAIDEALSVLPDLISVAREAAPRWALAVARPDSRPGVADDLDADLLARLSARYPKLFVSAATFGGSHAAGLLGLHAACAKLDAGALDACVLAGVDSWLGPETLEWLDSSEQLHGAGVLNNAWGFIPGEAGAAVLLMSERTSQELELPPLARVLGTSTAYEPKRVRTETVCIGEGLTVALRGALGRLPERAKVSDIYCDMNGEPYRADEFAFSALRTKEFFESVSDFNAPADCCGDVGAAGGVLHLMLACAAARKSYANGPLTLVWASGETGERAAALLATASNDAERRPRGR